VLVASGRAAGKIWPHVYYKVFIGLLFTEVYPQDCGARRFSSASDLRKHGKTDDDDDDDDVV